MTLSSPRNDRHAQVDPLDEEHGHHQKCEPDNKPTVPPAAALAAIGNGPKKRRFIHGGECNLHRSRQLLLAAAAARNCGALGIPTSSILLNRFYFDTQYLDTIIRLLSGTDYVG